MEKRNKILSFPALQSFCILYLVVWTISPFMSIDLIYRLVAVAAAGVWMIIAFIRKIQFTRSQIVAFAFLVLVIACAYFEYDDPTDMFKPISIYMLCLFYIMSVFYRDKWDELQWIVPIVFILLIVYDIRTAQVVIADPKVARLIVRNDESIYQYLRQGVGGYGLIYSQVVVFPTMLHWVLKSFKKNLLYFIIGSVWLVSYVVLILNAGYSIALFASAIGAVISFTYSGKRIVPAFIITLLAFFGVLALILYVEPLRNSLLEFFDGTAVARKIVDLVASADSAESEGSIASRMVAYESSLKALLDYPFIGSLWKSSRAGAHSSILDNFAKYGAFGGSFFAFSITDNILYIRHKYDFRPIIKICNGTLVSLLFVALLDNFSYEMMGMIFVILPLTFDCIVEHKGLKNGRA